jgi:ribosomal peptide maturation radical SAM protein 1
MKKDLHAFVETLDWKRYKLVGISVCLNQLSAALLLARMIKSRHKDIPIVLGGSNCAGRGESILKAFDEIDHVISGEGEVPLLALCRHLKGEKNSLPHNFLSRNDAFFSTHTEPLQIKDLNELFPPDFDDYFHELDMLPSEKRFFPLIPLEFSRGCWWGKCNFCNLNLQWKGYRKKTAERMEKEVDFLSRRYKIIDFSFMDNCLPPKESLSFFGNISKKKMDFSFFGELRAHYSRKEMKDLSKGGLKEIQVGIEALSSSLLKRLRKGKTAMDNVAMMRNAQEAGIELSGNLICHFPGSTEEEVEETLRVMDFAWPYRPLKPVSFWLGAGSPVEKRPCDFKVKAMASHPNYSSLFPMEKRKILSPMILQYRADRKIQKKLWKRVEKKAGAWKEEREKIGPKIKPLTFGRGKDFIIIKQVMPGGKVNMHRMSGLSTELYLSALEPVSLKALYEIAGPKKRTNVDKFVEDLIKKRLMFKEGDKVLSLAIHG